ncbi:YodC family protein [Bradyrhizobium sp.]|uniref:YodC family protein n=1 Tax=Bradyrhizobium sp. TaxID=376 RepID=UPI003D121033
MAKKAKTSITVISNETNVMEFNMFGSTKPAAIAIAATLVLGMPLAPAFSTSTPSNTAPQNQAVSAFKGGDLVRLRSGGPLMTVKGIKGNQVDCFWTDGSGQVNADSFPIDVLKKE